jgi:hypothetical protein
MAVSLAYVAVCDFEPEPPGAAHCNRQAHAQLAGADDYRSLLARLGWRYNSRTGQDFCPGHAEEQHP